MKPISKIIILKQLSNFFIWLIWDFSGLRLICYKIRPPINLRKDNRKPASFFIWFIGIYVALYSLSSQRYENRVDFIETYTNSVVSQLSGASFKEAISRISYIQNMECPYKPEVLKPISIIKSLFGDSINYLDIRQLLITTVENHKSTLDHTNLQGSYLKGAQLKNANLADAQLGGSNLDYANLENANCHKTSFVNQKITEQSHHHTVYDYERASLKHAILNNAIFSQTDLSGVDLTDSFIDGTNFENAKLNNSNFSCPDDKDWGVSISFGPGPNFKNGDLTGAKFNWRIMQNSNFENAKLDEVIFLGADLRNAIGLTAEQLSKVSTLFEAQLDSEMEKELKIKYPKLFDAPQKLAF